MCWAYFMTEHCDLTMQLCNTSDQRGKRSVALYYYALARRSSTKHSTQQSALTLKYWQKLGGMNRLYAVMTNSAHSYNICSHIWEAVRRLSYPPGYVPSNSDWSPHGRGGKPAAWKHRPCEHGPCKQAWPIKTELLDKQMLSKSRDVSLVHSPSFLSIFSSGRQRKKFKIKLIIFATRQQHFAIICGSW